MPRMDNHSLPTKTPPLAKIRILAVDDGVDNLELVHFILEQAGATVLVSTSATEALQHIVPVQPDVLLTDIGMPEMGSYTLLRKIRELAESKPVPTSSNVLKMFSFTVPPAIAHTVYAGKENMP